MPESLSPHLERGLNLLHATSLNVANMLGAGPFITIPVLLGTMAGPQAMLGWILGAVIAVCDGLVWAELGAARDTFGIPPGPCCELETPGGHRIAIYEATRPHVVDGFEGRRDF